MQEDVSATNQKDLVLGLLKVIECLAHIHCGDANLTENITGLLLPAFEGYQL